MNLSLTSNFPSTPNTAVAQRIHRVGSNARVAWVPPFTAMGRAKFQGAQTLFRALGVSSLEFCDIDEAPDEHQLACLDQYDIVYLTGGDPLGFQRNMFRCGFAERLRACVAAGRLIVAASGGAMQLGKNVSLFRLVSHPIDEVLAEHEKHETLGIVDYELLPHLNTFDSSFLEKVRQYSERLPCDIVALEDGAAMIHSNEGNGCTGRAVRFLGGIRDSIATAV